MAWAPSYITSAQLHDDLRIAIGDTVDDAMLGYAITAASRAIDQHCGRQFGQLAAPAARYYEPRWDRRQTRWVIPIDDLMTTTGLAVAADINDDGTYSTTLVLNTDFQPFPWNAAADNVPWTALAGSKSLVFNPPSSVLFDRIVRVTAQWGWSAVPDVVVQATLIQAARFFKRRDAPFGVAGSPDMGSELRLLAKLDPDVQLLLDPVRRLWGLG
jgi:hypothetical protein